MRLTTEQVLQLAPDDAARKAGAALASPGKWVTLGLNAEAAWGQCQGSGSKPYQTQVDLTGMAFKCSCPSRKFPCKHGVGLLLLAAAQPSLFRENTPPDWVAGWLEQRKTKKATQQDKGDKKPDPEAQAKRLESRELRVSDGVEELQLWIRDIFRQGILSMPQKHPTLIAQLSKRMVDAQAPGLAALVREMGRINFFEDGWQEELTEQLLNLELLAAAWKNRDGLEEIYRLDIAQRLGFTQNQEALRATDGVQDTWLVCGRQLAEDDGIVTEKYWMYGLTKGRTALVLQFIIRGQSQQLNLVPGTFLDAALVYFPAVQPLRALVKEPFTVASFPNGSPEFPEGLSPWATQLSEDYARFPLLSERLMTLKSIKPVRYDERWWLQDNDGQLAPIDSAFRETWKLLAISGGRPVTLTVVSSRNRTLYPLGIWENEQYSVI